MSPSYSTRNYFLCVFLTPSHTVHFYPPLYLIVLQGENFPCISRVWHSVWTLLGGQYMRKGILCQQEETKVNLTHGCWNRSIYLIWPMQLQVLGDLKAVSAGANKSLMKTLSSSIIAQLVFDCLNAVGNNAWDSESYRQACKAGNTQN